MVDETKLITERLVLRPPEPADLGAAMALLADPVVTQFLLPGRRLTPEDAKDAFELTCARFSADGYGMFTVIQRSDGRIIGQAGLVVWNPEHWFRAAAAWLPGQKEVELGCIVDPRYWSKGYATECLAVVRDWALNELNLHRLIALVDPRNAAALRCAHRVGLSFERDVVIAGKERSLLALAAVDQRDTVDASGAENRSHVPYP